MKAIRGVVIRKDRTRETLEMLKALTRSEVLVGIPESTTSRDNEDGADITNAQIGYLMETGSPAANIPARPSLIPGVEAAQDVAVAQLQEAAKAALRGDEGRAQAKMSDAGILCANSVKRTINSNIPPPLSPATIRGRAAARGSATPRASERAYLKMVSLGADPADAQAETGIVALVNTGQFRNSITSVVRKK